MSKIPTDSQWEDLATRINNKADASSIPTVVQTTGSSTTDVMSQKATTWMIYNGGDTKKVQIGVNSGAVQNWDVAILGTANQEHAIAIGDSAAAEARGGIALGVGARVSTQGVFDVGLSGVGASTQSANGYNGSAYRLLSGLYDPQNAHDAATKGYIDSLVGDIEAALNAINNGGNA